jgi:hypothetical protein
MDISLNGADVIILAGRNLTKFFDKDYGLLTFPNELANVKVGKSGNAVISLVNMGVMGELTLRILLGTSDDAFLNSLQRGFLIDPPSFELVDGSVIKRSGDGGGFVTDTVYSLEAGVPTTIPESHSNADGDEEQGVAVWKFKFARGARSTS